MADLNQRKAALLYECIDNSSFYKRNTVAIANRSRMNVPFQLRDDALDAVFLREAEAEGLMSLKGHRFVWRYACQYV